MTGAATGADQAIPIFGPSTCRVEFSVFPREPKYSLRRSLEPGWHRLAEALQPSSRPTAPMIP